MFDNKNILLYPVALVYGAVTGVRNYLYNKNLISPVEFSIPIICVGNISMGGTGKTPHTEYLARLLANQFNVAVLSRGYKRKSRGFRFVETSSAAGDCGDEPLQIKQKLPYITVAVDSNRINGVNRILEEKPGTGVIILDDGFQHRSLKPGLSIVLSDYGKPLSTDHLLPYGSLRESRSNINRADILVITKTPSTSTGEIRMRISEEFRKKGIRNVFFTSIMYQEPVPVFPRSEHVKWDSISGNEAVLVTGIANPGPLDEYLRQFFPKMVHLAFSDHHDFSEKDIAKLSQTWNELKSTRKYIITTEKDAVRLREFGNIAGEMQNVFYYIPVGIEFPADDKDEFDKLITAYAGKYRRNN